MRATQYCNHGGHTDLSIQGSGVVTIQLVNAFTGNITLEASVDGGHWFAVSLTPVGGGAASINMTAQGVYNSPVMPRGVSYRVNNQADSDVFAYVTIG